MRKLHYSTLVTAATLIVALLLSGCFGGSAPRPVASEITDDGSGGAIIVWPTEKGACAQRLDSQGSCLWGKKGRQIYSVAAHPISPLVAGDSAGGAIIAWTDEHHSSADTPQWGVYVQRLDPQGRVIWTEEGISVSAGPFDVNQGQVEMINESLIELINDGSGGAILLWYNELKINDHWETTVHVQRLGPDGEYLWGNRGIQICDTAPDPRWAKLVSDGSGGVIIVWEDNRGQDTRIYSQRISSDGGMLWPNSGIPVASGSGAQLQPQIIDDGMGNFIIAWMESSHPQYDIGENNIYVQKIDADGKLLWTEGGIPLCTASKNQTHPELASDGSGGCIVVWHDTRNRPNRDVYAQRVSSEGKILWEADGVLIWDVSGVDKSSIEAGSYDIQIIDDSTGAIVVWQANPKSATVGAFKGGRIYTQRLSPTGERLWPEAIRVYENPSLKSQAYSSVVSDSAGGVIIGSIVGKGDWPDLVYAQRVDAEGDRLWGEKGIRLNP